MVPPLGSSFYRGIIVLPERCNNHMKRPLGTSGLLGANWESACGRQGTSLVHPWVSLVGGCKDVVGYNGRSSFDHKRP